MLHENNTTARLGVNPEDYIEITTTIRTRTKETKNKTLMHKTNSHVEYYINEHY